MSRNGCPVAPSAQMLYARVLFPAPGSELSWTMQPGYMMSAQRDAGGGMYARSRRRDGHGLPARGPDARPGELLDDPVNIFPFLAPLHRLMPSANALPYAPA